MSSYKIIIITIFLILFSGCVTKQNYFEDENRLIILGLDSEARGDLNSSYGYFNKLYSATNNLEYKIKEINLLIKLKELRIAKLEIKEALKIYKNNLMLKKLLITIYLQEQDFDKSLKIALEILNQEKEIRNYDLISSIYLLQQKYDEALKYLDGAYAIDHSEKILDKIITTFYIYTGDKAKAISYLETHIRLYGCSKKFCTNLIAMYAEKQDVDGLISIYKRMYKEFKDRIYGKKVAELLIFKKDFKGVVKFLESSGIDDKLLLDIYKIEKSYSKARDLTLRFYKKTNDINYLAQSAMLEYEGSIDKSNKKILDSVIKKLKEVVSLLDNDVYQNYLGYLLIEHDLDLKAGMELIKKALQKDENSVYYLDSLAWGYYKLKNYKEAYKLMKIVVDKIGLDDSEVIFHWNTIKSSLKKEDK